MGDEFELGFFNCEVGLVQMGLIFLIHRILDRFLQAAAAVVAGGGAAAVVVGEVGGKDWLFGIGSKEKVGVLYRRWWRWCNGDHGVGGGGG